MDGPADILGIGTHLHGQHCLVDQFAGVASANPGPDDAAGGAVKQCLADALSVPRTQGAAAGVPGEGALAIGDAPFCGLLFRDAHPGDLRRGVCHRRYGHWRKSRLTPGNDLSGHFTLVRRLMGQHRLPHHIANGINMGHGGLLAFIDREKAMCIDFQANFIQAQPCGVRPASDSYQYHVVFTGFLLPFSGETDLDAAVPGDNFRDPGTGQEPVFILQFAQQGLHQVLVGGWNKLVAHLDDGDSRPQGAVNLRHLQADNAATNDQ